MGARPGARKALSPPRRADRRMPAGSHGGSFQGRAVTPDQDRSRIPAPPAGGHTRGHRAWLEVAALGGGVVEASVGNVLRFADRVRGHVTHRELALLGVVRDFEIAL